MYIYQPGAVLPGWMLVTVGRCTEQVAGQRVELVQHLRPQEDEDAMHEAADVLRSVALLWGRVEPSWTFKPLHDERFVALGKELVYQPTFLLAVFKRGSEAGR